VSNGRAAPHAAGIICVPKSPNSVPLQQKSVNDDVRPNLNKHSGYDSLGRRRPLSRSQNRSCPVVKWYCFHDVRMRSASYRSSRTVGPEGWATNAAASRPQTQPRDTAQQLSLRVRVFLDHCKQPTLLRSASPGPRRFMCSCRRSSSPEWSRRCRSCRRTTSRWTG
jgi:hypothetical protein